MEKDNTVDENPLVMTDGLWNWFDETCDYMQDDDFRETLKTVVRIMANEFPEPAKIAAVIARLEAQAIKYRMGYTAYMSYKKGTKEANMRKNHYKQLYEGIDRLADALKYVIR